MSSPPLILVHILYDSRAVDESLVLEFVSKLPGYFGAPEQAQRQICLNLVRLGYIFSLLETPDYRVDLRAGFENVLLRQSELKVGTGNPEVLVFLGTPPIDNWQDTHEALEMQFRDLILTYWLERGNLSGAKSLELDNLLKKISRPDPNQRHKIVAYRAEDEARGILEDIFRKLAARLDKRLLSIGKIIATS